MVTRNPGHEMYHDDFMFLLYIDLLAVYFCIL
jgi:hypothetical protein